MDGPSPRVVKETKTLANDPVEGIKCVPDQNNFKHFFVSIQGITTIIKAPKAHALKEEISTPSSCCPMITQCPPRKLFLIPKSTIPTSVYIF